jgi:hypothetical protein
MPLVRVFAEKLLSQENYLMEFQICPVEKHKRNFLGLSFGLEGTIH